MHGFDIHHIHHRIGGSFDPDQLGFGIDFCSHIGGVLHIDKVKPNPKVFKYLGENPIATAIEIIGRNHLVSRGEQLDDRIDGGHARSKAESVGTIFDTRQSGFECRSGGVVCATVFIAHMPSGCALGIGGGQINGGHHSAIALVGMLSAMNRF